MIIDPSVIIAIIYGEPEEPAFLELIAQTPTCLLAAPSYFDASFVVSSEQYRSSWLPIKSRHCTKS